MPSVNVVVETETSNSARVAQLEGMFDCPREEKQRLRWEGSVPFDERDWSVGLIVGPSGCGKSTVVRSLFGSDVDVPMRWGASSVIDDFSQDYSIRAVSDICQAVGFNTIPAWMRPFRVLSNGEQFRVNLARRLLELPDPVVVDEFTSVVDRQVAKIVSHAVQKYVRRHKRKFVACSCHYDVLDWLQPDWVLEPATMTFAWRLVQPRPKLNVSVKRVPYATWSVFAPFHYMSATLHRSAQCFGLFVEDRIACFCAMLPRPVSTGNHRQIRGVSRIVTLPDYQGIGLAFILTELLASAYKSIGLRYRNYPAHPSYVRSLDRSNKWAIVKKPGKFSSIGRSKTIKGKIGGRPCAVFEYIGPAMEDKTTARKLISGTEDAR